MKEIFCSILVSCFILSGCSCPVGGGDKRVVAQVGKYKMTVEDLRYDLKNVPYDEITLLDTEEGRMRYLSRLIEKEILLQEAQQQGLDREKDFMRSIESHWEQALLKLLLQRKSRQISDLIHVYDNEIRDYYADSGETLPLSRVKREIRKALRQKKETEAMDAWVEELRKDTYIKVDSKVLEEVLSN